MAHKLLLAEDTIDMNKVITAVLERDGYEVDTFFDGEAALSAFQDNKYDAAILDIMMPKMTGLDVLKKVRKEGDETPIILLTAKSEIEDRVTGLDAGANDYLTKPFSMKELLARVRALLRTKNVETKKVLEFKDLKVDTEQLTVTTVNTVSLSNHEFELLKQLINNSDRELETSFILSHVWNEDEGADEDTVWLYISYLKDKLSSISSSVEIDGTRGGSFRLK